MTSVGMAVRLAYDFGLHMSPKQYVDTGEMTPTEARLRNTTFWGVFLIDRMWAIYLGRPFQSCLEDITVERPLSGESHSSTATSFWKPYGTPGENQIELPDIQGFLTDRWVALFEIMSRLGHSRKLFSSCSFYAYRIKPFHHDPSSLVSPQLNVQLIANSRFCSVREATEYP